MPDPLLDCLRDSGRHTRLLFLGCLSTSSKHYSNNKRVLSFCQELGTQLKGKKESRPGLHSLYKGLDSQGSEEHNTTYQQTIMPSPNKTIVPTEPPTLLLPPSDCYQLSHSGSQHKISFLERQCQHQQ